MLNQLVSREINPLEPAVLSFGVIKGGTARNILADKVQIEGTFRTLSYETQATILRRIHEILKGLAKAYGIEYEIKHKEGSPPLTNNPAETQFIEEIGNEVLGSECIEYLRYPTMGGEDFALYIQKVAGMFFRLGTANPMKNADWELHSNAFDVDERAITVGIEILTAATLRKLGCF
jgi:amidohydrolase